MGTIRGMGAALGASMLTTEALLIAQGRWQEAIPLHLCSVSALLAFAAAMGARGFALDFLWYLGLPGALLAMIFPAPAPSGAQTLFNLSYMTTHAMIVLIPLALMLRGARPREGREAHMLAAMGALAAAAHGVNRLLGTNFLFLASPPAPSPLELAMAAGRGAYIALLAGMMLLICLAQGKLLRLARGGGMRAVSRIDSVQIGESAV